MRVSFKSVYRAALCASALLVANAKADLISYSGTIDTYTISTTGIYDITVAGAQGGTSFEGGGGLGAVISGDITLTAGTQLDIVVGGMGLTGAIPFAYGGGERG